MRLARPSVPTAIGLAAACAGVIDVVSASTPSIAARSDIVEGVLPPGVPEAARVVALALGLVLLWLWRSLVRRKRRAWQLAVAIVVASAVAHLAKGLDFEEASAHLLLLAALLRYRGEFSAPGDPAVLRPLARVVLALGAVAALATIRIEGHDLLPERLEYALGGLAVVLAARALYLWLRPLALRVRQTEGERLVAERIVREHGADSLAFFALRRDRSWFFSPTRRSFLSYRVVNGCALVGGDPIGAVEELPELLASFRGFARGRGWRVAVLGASERLLPVYRSCGLRSIYLGDEAVLRPEEFSLEGRAIRKVRQSAHRLRKAGYRVRILGPDEADETLRADLREVSHDWRGRWPERGFVMTMDALWAYPEAVLAVALDAEGRVGGFLQLVPSPASDGWSLATMRRRRGTPNGLMEYLIVETVDWARKQHVAELSLNFAVFAEMLRADAASAAWRRGLRLCLRGLDRFFQLERLLRFNGKFLPAWRPRYICVEHVLDFPVVGLAYLHAESLLTPPGPWARTHDLTTA